MSSKERQSFLPVSTRLREGGNLFSRRGGVEVGSGNPIRRCWLVDGVEEVDGRGEAQGDLRPTAAQEDRQ